MTKPTTTFNDLEMWKSRCQDLQSAPLPKTVADCLRIAVPDQHERISGNWDLIGDGEPMPSLPFDGDRFAEARTPIARASTAILQSRRVKRDETKRRHLKVALAWLKCQHPWQGPRTKLEIEAMIEEVSRAIEDPSLSLDHILDRSFYFRFHPKIVLPPEDRELSIAIRDGLQEARRERPALLRRAFNRLFGFRA
ncbi:MAG: hypothetical protein R3F54_28805 [Alphaproteobacteria bacterium]